VNIFISDNDMLRLLAVRPDVYEIITTSQTFDPAPNSDLYLDQAISQEMGVVRHGYVNYIKQGSGAFVFRGTSADGSAEGWNISIDSTGAGKPGGFVGDINGDSITIAGWKLGPDVYNNLCIQSPDGTSKVIFGLNGNMGINTMNIIPSGAVAPGNVVNKGMTIGKWSIGDDGGGNLCFQSPGNIITFGSNGFIGVNDVFCSTDALVPVSADGGKLASPTQVGPWQIGGDGFGNLCFLTASSNILFDAGGTVSINGVNITANSMGR
jgi:hypothetical protein